MFGSIGMPELVIILVIALIIFGPRKLPELGKSLGRSLNEFKKASNDLQNTLEQEIKLEEQKESAAAARKSGSQPWPGIEPSTASAPNSAARNSVTSWSPSKVASPRNLRAMCSLKSVSRRSPEPCMRRSCSSSQNSGR